MGNIQCLNQFHFVKILCNFHFRQSVDLMGLLDYEIWKASSILGQTIPLQCPPEHPSEGDKWMDFGPHWK